MSEKGLASLTSSLLARKGQARPAMRSQNFGAFGRQPSLEDLGWNDMGEPVAPAAVTPFAAIPVAANPVAAAEELIAHEGDAIPTVLVERASLEQRLAVPAAVKPVSVATATRLRRETAHAGKAAFTLRVDADRHLKLRLASAITNRSAQDLVTEALDALLGAIPEVDALVAQLPLAKPRRKGR